MGPTSRVNSPAQTSARQVELIPVLDDNYIFVWHGGPGSAAVVVDPAVAEPVVAWLRERDLELVAVLQTHHHSDHIGGTPELLRHWPRAEVVAARADRKRIPFQTRGVAGGDRFMLLGQPVEVLDVPGHTRTHLAFHLPLQGELFCGDTLFAGGCGRLFEGSAEQMHRSLGLLAALPEHTRVWCAHEYTEANLRWAAAARPQDHRIAARLAAVRRLREQGRPTIPTSIGEERRTTLFVQAASADELAALRRSKEAWAG